MSIINPYSNVSWNLVEQVPSCSHEHGRRQDDFNRLIDGGLRHVALSNYYPSAPYYPLDDYFTVPQGVIGSPNAEHHNISSYSNFHCNGLGSFFESGSPQGEEPVGMNGASWKTTFDKILSQLQYEDGGGVTINHPHWTRDASSSPHPTTREICEMLDYNDKVLGIEFFNGSAERIMHDGWDLDTWDSILLTGRRCWGFCVADHDGEENVNWIGRNILLCSEFTEHECLKAYREGRFYGKIKNTNLIFDSITVSGRTINVEAGNAEQIKIIVDGIATTIQGHSASYSVPSGAVYARVEAHTSEDSVYSQAFTFRPYQKKDDSMTKMLLLLND